MRVERGAWLEIDTAKLILNHMEVMHAVDAEAKRCGRKIKVCSVLKAQCYGIGGIQTAKIPESLDCPPDAYAVACLSEALELRTVTSDKEILILGYVAEDCYDTAIANGITLPMYRADALDAFNRKAGEMGRKGLAHVAVNSGMNRLGFLPTEEKADIVAAAFRLPHPEINGIFTHLAVADETDKSPVRMQMGRFDAFLDMLRARNVTLPTVHAAASPSICDLPEYYKEKRGGRTMCNIVISDGVESPIISEADIMLIFDERSLKDYQALMSENGTMIINSDLVETQPETACKNIKKVPLSTMAQNLGNSKTANVVALGDIPQFLPMIPYDKIAAEVEKSFAAKPKLIPLNPEALKAGYEYR